MMKNRVLILVVLLTLFSSSLIYAQDGPFTVLFDLEGVPATAPETLTATISGSGIVGIDLSRGPAIEPFDLTNGFSANEWVLSDETLEAAIAAGAYFEFGLSVEAGFSVSLETLDLSLRRSALNAPMYYELQASLDNFATPGITVKAFEYYGRTSGTAPVPSPLDNDPYYYMHSDLAGRANEVTSPGDPIPTVDLTDFAEFANLSEGTDVTFRLYAWGNEKTASTNTVAFGRMVGPKITGTSVAK